jgi:hypothetical protein
MMMMMMMMMMVMLLLCLLCAYLLSGLCAKIRARWSVVRIAILHRIGTVGVSEASVAIAVSSVHRREGLEAVHWAIDELKVTIPCLFIAFVVMLLLIMRMISCLCRLVYLFGNKNGIKMAVRGRISCDIGEEERKVLLLMNLVCIGNKIKNLMPTV